MFNEILNKEKVNVGKLKNEKTLKKSFNLFKVGSLSKLRGRKKSDIAVTRVWDSGVEILNVQIWRVSSTIKSPLLFLPSWYDFHLSENFRSALFQKMLLYKAE